MRFVLDNDVDAAVVGVITSAGHQAWTAASAGLAGSDSANDDEVSVYAAEHGAAVMTHDVEFTRRRRRNTFGHHVHLRCENPDAVELVQLHLDEVVEHLASTETLVVKVSRAGVERYPPLWK